MTRAEAHALAGWVAKVDGDAAFVRASTCGKLREAARLLRLARRHARRAGLDAKGAAALDAWLRGVALSTSGPVRTGPAVPGSPAEGGGGPFDFLAGSLEGR